MNGFKVIIVELERYMYTVKSKDGKIEGQVFGSVSGKPGIMAVSVKPNGAGMFYCLKHQLFFSTKFNQCPECGNTVSQSAAEGASTALDADIS